MVGLRNVAKGRRRERQKRQKWWVDGKVVRRDGVVERLGTATKSGLAGAIARARVLSAHEDIPQSLPTSAFSHFHSRQPPLFPNMHESEL